jgi:hypothetical protein
MPDPEQPEKTTNSSVARGCGFAAGILFLIALVSLALFANYLSSLDLPGPNDKLGFAIISVILWVIAGGVVILLFKLMRKQIRIHR